MPLWTYLPSEPWGKTEERNAYAPILKNNVGAKKVTDIITVLLLAVNNILSLSFSLSIIFP